MRTEAELTQTYKRIGDLLNSPEYEDDETLQAIYETLKWFDGHEWDVTVGGYLPLA